MLQFRVIPWGIVLVASKVNFFSTDFISIHSKKMYTIIRCDSLQFAVFFTEVKLILYRSKKCFPYNLFRCIHIAGIQINRHGKWRNQEGNGLGK